MSTETFSVRGMSCGHCAHAVEQEVGAVDGVDTVSVDLAGGTVTVTGAFADQAVRDAIREAGYDTA